MIKQLLNSVIANQLLISSPLTNQDSIFAQPHSLIVNY